MPPLFLFNLPWRISVKKTKLIVGLLVIFGVAVSCGRTGVEPVGPGIRTESLIVDNTADVGQYNCLKIGSDDIPRISYYDFQDGDLRYAYLRQGKWEVSTLDSVGDVGMYSSMDLDSNNYPHIVYYDITNDRLKYIFQVNQGVWSDPQVIYNRRGGLAASIALDHNGLAHISFIDSVGHDLYYLSQNSDGSFSEDKAVVIDDGTQVFGSGGIIGGEYTHIALTPPPHQRPVILYYNASYGALMIAMYDPDNPEANRGAIGTGWVIKIIDGKLSKNKSDVGKWSSLYIAGPNNYHVCYYDATNGNLKYAHYDGDAWTIETVDSIGIVGESCSITLDHRGVPIISYYDSTNNDLKVAIRGYGRWTTFRVDTAGIVGTFSTIARFHHQQRIGIAYHDWTRKALKFMIVFSF